MELAIWWTSQSDCERACNMMPQDAEGWLAPDGWPPYLADELHSRDGRAGRGRLWVPSHIDLTEVAEADWTASAGIGRAAEDAGGIVLEAQHVELIRSLPGFVTDIRMRLWGTPQP